MSDEEKYQDQPFLTRWSQRKIEARAAQAEAPALAEEETPVPQLPPIEELTPESDFSVFMHPKVDPDLRRAALKKLFSDPHFNVMDGLDTYIDDYSKPDPLPPGMLAGLRQAQQILAWAQQTKDEAAKRIAGEPAPALEDGENNNVAPGESLDADTHADPVPARDTGRNE